MSDGVARLLKEILVTQNRGGCNQIADDLGCSYDEVWEATHERANPSVRIVAATYARFPDLRLKRLLEPAGYELVHKQDGPRSVGDVCQETTDVVLASAEAVRLARESLTGNARQAAKLLAALDLVENELAEARAAAAKLI